MAVRIHDFDGIFFRGANSASDPGQLPLGYYWMTWNMLNQGGVIGCRPGYRCLLTLPEGKLQGATLFRPRVGLEQLIVAVSGSIYVADYPFLNFRRMPNVQFSPTAREIYWETAEQSARRLDLTLESPIEIIQTKRVLMMQDGGTTAAAYYDGTESGHLRDNLYLTPSGSVMRWIGDRLWVAKGSLVLASDIGNPLSFREQIYLGGTAAFTFSDDVTAMATTPSLEFPQLLVFTESKTSLIKANIRNRELWLTTEDMSREIFNVGCSSQRSVVASYGQLTWFSQSGIVFFDSAALSKQSARLPTRDSEMATSKQALFENLSTVAGASFGSYLLMSVPAEDVYNNHTWVLNNASLESLSDDSGPSWASIWTGTRPVEWVYGNIAGSERIFYVSVDHDGQNRLWEAFVPGRLDNGCPILWALETRGYFGMHSNQKLAGHDAQLCFADVNLTALEQDVDVAVFYAGSNRGAYKKIAEKQIKVSVGSIQSGVEITSDTILFGLKPQSRKLRTEEARLKLDDNTGGCPAEGDQNEDIDEHFQLYVTGCGPATIRSIRVYGTPESEDQSGNDKACEAETDFAAVRFDGFGSVSPEEQEAITALATLDLQVFESNQTAAVELFGQTSVDVGSFSTVVSQAAADRVARIIAEKRAENNLLRQMPPTLSLGEGFDE